MANKQKFVYLIELQVDEDVLDWYTATYGDKGYQSAMNKALRIQMGRGMDAMPMLHDLSPFSKR